MRFILSLAFLLAAGLCTAQTTYSISDPIDIPKEGWNKVLMASNGNTLLFHFEYRKGIVVKVFDNTHKEISSKKHLCKILDINQLDHAIIRGIYDINGETNLFIEQSYYNNNTLILLRINPADGSLIEEKKLIQSESFANKTSYHVLKARKDNYYSVFCMKDLVHHPADTLELIRFNNKHEKIARSIFQLNVKPYDFYYLVSANIDNHNSAICITLQLAKKVVSGVDPVYDKDILVGYLSADESSFHYKMMQLPHDGLNVHSAVLYGQFSYSSLPRQANLVLLSRKSFFYQDGIDKGVHVNMNALFIAMNDTDIHAGWVTNDKIASYIKSYYNDTLAVYNGIPIKIYSNDAGNSMVVYEEYAVENTVEAGRFRLRTALGNTGIAEYNSKGEEIWGMALPKAQSLRNFLYAGEVADRGNLKYLFRGQKPDDYETQFASIDCFNHSNDYYIFYNDFARNATDATDSALKTVYQYNFENAFDNTNAFYYKLGPDKEVKKYFLFGMPEKGESKANFLESADYDPATNTYVTMLLYRKDKTASSHIAWCKME